MFTININFISSATQTNTTYAYLLILLVNKQQTAGPHSNHDKFINSIHSCCESKHYVNKKKILLLAVCNIAFLICAIFNIFMHRWQKTKRAADDFPIKLHNIFDSRFFVFIWLFEWNKNNRIASVSNGMLNFILEAKNKIYECEFV